MMNEENDDECEDTFYLYHSFGQSAGYGYIPKKKMIQMLGKNGLMSHSTIGRRKDIDDVIVALTTDRIWFSRKLGCEFTKESDPLVLRVKFSEAFIEDEFGEIQDDDQYFSKDRCEVFLEKNDEFVIPPWDIEYLSGKRWIRVSPWSRSWKKPRRTIEERMQPSIREDFKRLGLSPRDDFHVKAYVYLQPDDKIKKEEFKKEADEMAETIMKYTIFDHDIC